MKIMKLCRNVLSLLQSLSLQRFFQFLRERKITQKHDGAISRNYRHWNLKCKSRASVLLKKLDTVINIIGQPFSISELNFLVLDEIWSATISEASLVLSNRERQYIYFCAWLGTPHLCHWTLCSHASLIILESIKLWHVHLTSLF